MEKGDVASRYMNNNECCLKLQNKLKKVIDKYKSLLLKTRKQCWETLSKQDCIYFKESIVPIPEWLHADLAEEIHKKDKLINKLKKNYPEVAKDLGLL